MIAHGGDTAAQVIPVASGDAPAAALEVGAVRACGPASPCLALASEAMRTRFELVLVDDGRGSAALRAVGETALAEIVDLGEQLSRFRRDGIVRHLERTAPHGWARVDRDLFDLLALCVDVWRRSGGLFDITLGSLMRVHGFHGLGGSAGTSDDSSVVGLEQSDSDVAPTALASATGRAGCEAIEFDPLACAVRFTRPLELDLGGVAKGFALDRATRVLGEHGIRNALLHGGTSSIVALGAPDDASRGWSIAIASPAGHRRVLLRNAALAVSAGHGRMVEGQPHIIDPRLAAPASGAADVAAIHLPLGEPSTPWPAACADAWTKPALLEARRPEQLPSSATVFIVARSRVTVDNLPTS